MSKLSYTIPKWLSEKVLDVKKKYTLYNKTKQNLFDIKTEKEICKNIKNSLLKSRSNMR